MQTESGSYTSEIQLKGTVAVPMKESKKEQIGTKRTGENIRKIYKELRKEGRKDREEEKECKEES